MDQVLLETIVEKLESLEISLLKENNTEKNVEIQETLLKEIKIFQSEIANLSPLFKVSNDKIDNLSKNIDALIFKLEKGVNENINHSHHLHKGVWITIGFFLTSLLLLYGWINCYNTKNTFEANDIKYRFLKVNGNAVLIKILYQTDSIYKLNNDLFIKRVVSSEESLSHQAELLRLAGERKRSKMNYSQGSDDFHLLKELY